MQFELFEHIDKVKPKIKALPKIDLHRHLLGSLPAESVIKIARKYHVSLPSQQKEDLENMLAFDKKVSGLKEFFKPWRIYSKLLVSPDALYDITYDVLMAASVDQICYTELRASWGMTGRENFPVADFLSAIDQAIRDAEKDCGIIGRVVLGITRHLMGRHPKGKQRYLYKNILEAAIKFKDHCVVGFDLSGIENHYPPITFKNFFREVKKYGFKTTIHCGETVGPNDIWQSLTDLKADRISHAITAIQDRALMAYIVKNQIPVEISLTSNLLTNSIKDILSHPILPFSKENVTITLNTDNPSICKVTLSDEFCMLFMHLNFNWPQILAINENAAYSIFSGEEVQAQIFNKIFRYYDSMR